MRQFFHTFFRTLSCVAGLVAHAVMFGGVCYYFLTTPLEVQSGMSGVGAAYLALQYCVACGCLGLFLSLLDGFNIKGWYAALGLFLCATPFVTGIAAANVIALLQ